MLPFKRRLLFFCAASLVNAQINEFTTYQPVDQRVADDDSAYLFQDLNTAYANLGPRARTMIDFAAKGYDQSSYNWGDTIDSFSFWQDALQKECLGRFEIFNGQFCDTNQPINSRNWDNILKDINRVSRSPLNCQRDYDLLGNGQRRTDFRVQCSHRGITLSFYEPNSGCATNKFIGDLKGSWTQGNSNCLSAEQTSFRFTRNDQKYLNYYRSAYEADRWIQRNNWKNNAGQCLIRDFDVYLDRNCSVKSESLDKEMQGAVDVANTVATHAVNRCGVIGHLFPFGGPFGQISCSGVALNFSQFDDFQCTRRDGSFIYRWGDCQPIPWTSQGLKYVRMYQTNRPDNLLYYNQNNTTDDVHEDVIYTLSSVFVFLTLAIACMSCCMYNMRQGAVNDMEKNMQSEMGNMSQQNENMNNSVNSNYMQYGQQSPGRRGQNSPNRNKQNYN